MLLYIYIMMCMNFMNSGGGIDFQFSAEYDRKIYILPYYRQLIPQKKCLGRAARRKGVFFVIVQSCSYVQDWTCIVYAHSPISSDYDPSVCRHLIGSYDIPILRVANVPLSSFMNQCYGFMLRIGVVQGRTKYPSFSHIAERRRPLSLHTIVPIKPPRRCAACQL